jgi:hypothetical protein
LICLELLVDKDVGISISEFWWRIQAGLIEFGRNVPRVCEVFVLQLSENEVPDSLQTKLGS